MREFNLRQAAREAIHDHPALQENTIFVNSSEKYKKYSSLKARLTALFNASAKKDIKEGMQTQEMFTSHEPNNPHSYKILFFSSRSFSFINGDQDADDWFAFDHEIGHLTIPENHNDFNERDAEIESASDSYATIRHLQRFGNNSSLVETCGGYRALIFVDKPDPEYVTTFAIDQILQDRKYIDFEHLTIEETKEKAENYSKACAPFSEDVQSVMRDFELLKGELSKITPDNLKPLNILATITLRENVHSMTAYLGAKALQLFFREEGFIINGKCIKLSGDVWDQIAQKVEKILETTELRITPKGIETPESARRSALRYV